MACIRKTVITAKRLRELFDYNPRTGIFTYKIGTRCTKAGRKAGTPRYDGYLVVNIDNRTYLLHRLAWLWMMGKMPPRWLDHRNHNPADNRFSNLRLSTRAQNQQNRPKNKNNSSGFKGVSYSTGIIKKPWRATITADGKSLHLGHFATKAEAFVAYQNAARQLHREFAGV